MDSKSNQHTKSFIVEPGVYKIPILDQNQIPYTIVDHKANVMGACFWFCLLYALNIDMITFIERLILGLTPDDCVTSYNLDEPSILEIHPDAKDLSSCANIIINSLIDHKYKLGHPSRSYPILLRIFPEISSITTINIVETSGGEWKHDMRTKTIVTKQTKNIAIRFPTQLEENTTGLNIIILSVKYMQGDGHCLNVLVEQDISSLLFDNENVYRFPYIMMRME